jgi:hypothetical protein
MSETYKPNLETQPSASLDAKLDAEFDASTINLFEEQQENEDRFMDGLHEE